MRLEVELPPLLRAPSPAKRHHRAGLKHALNRLDIDMMLVEAFTGQAFAAGRSHHKGTENAKDSGQNAGARPPHTLSLRFSLCALSAFAVTL